MRLIHVIAVLLAVILCLLGVLMVWPEPMFVAGGAHPEIRGMNVGGDGLARLGGAHWLLFALQCSVLVLKLLLVALGVAEHHRDRTFWCWLTLIGVVVLGVWWGMYSSYLDYLHSGESPIALGFPLATAFMLFGVYTGGSLLCVLYVAGFRRFIFSEADEAAYEALRAEANAPRASS